MTATWATSLVTTGTRIFRFWPRRRRVRGSQAWPCSSAAYHLATRAHSRGSRAGRGVGRMTCSRRQKVPSCAHERRSPGSPPTCVPQRRYKKRPVAMHSSWVMRPVSVSTPRWRRQENQYTWSPRGSRCTGRKKSSCARLKVRAWPPNGSFPGLQLSILGAREPEKGRHREEAATHRKTRFCRYSPT